MDAPAHFDSADPQSSEGRWAAKLSVALSPRTEKTRITDLRHYGPLRIQRPFYPEHDGTAHVYLIHPPGGVAGGDMLHVHVVTEPDAKALFTMPAATKLYRSADKRAGIVQTLTIREGSSLEWLPQETIAFSGAKTDLSTIVRLEEGAQFFGWEILCLGRPASGDSFSHGDVRGRFEIWQEETPLFVDRLLVGDGRPTRNAVWGMRGQPVVGTLSCVTPRELAPLIREATHLENARKHLACTDLMGVTVVRYAGPSVPECWEAFRRVWQTVRPALLGKAAEAPRIWSY